MPEIYINRSAGLAPDQSNKLNASTIRVDSVTDELKIGVGASGVVERVVLDRTSALTAQVTITGDGAITIQNSTVLLTKGSAAAITLAAPTAAQAGTRIEIISGSAFAHVVTATGLLDNGVTGGSKNTATFAAFAGASITLIAAGLKWTVLSSNVVTVA